MYIALALVCMESIASDYKAKDLLRKELCQASKCCVKLMLQANKQKSLSEHQFAVLIEAVMNLDCLGCIYARENLSSELEQKVLDEIDKNIEIVRTYYEHVFNKKVVYGQGSRTS